MKEKVLTKIVLFRSSIWPIRSDVISNPLEILSSKNFLTHLDREWLWFWHSIQHDFEKKGWIPTQQLVESCSFAPFKTCPLYKCLSLLLSRNFFLKKWIQTADFGAENQYIPYFWIQALWRQWRLSPRHLRQDVWLQEFYHPRCLTPRHLTTMTFVARHLTPDI